MFKRHYYIFEVLQILLGSLILAASAVFFTIPFEIVTGGVAGLAVALHPIIHIEHEIIIVVTMIITFIFGLMVLGKKFALKSLLSTIAFPLFMYGLECLNLPVLNIDQFLASFYGGILMGIGVGLVFRVNASTGGFDIPPLILHKYFNIPLARLVLIVDSLVIGIGILAHGIEAFLIGFVAVLAASVTIDKVLMLAGAKTKSIYIISDHYLELNDAIQDQLERGTTLLYGRGGYLTHDKKIILVVILQTQYPKLHNLVSSIDPKAFMIINNATEVKGEGFISLNS